MSGFFVPGLPKSPKLFALGEQNRKFQLLIQYLDINSVSQSTAFLDVGKFTKNIQRSFLLSRYKIDVIVFF